MTQSTEQERAEFLKANIRGPFNEALNHREKGIAFAAWQAARRAQVVQQGLIEKARQLRGLVIAHAYDIPDTDPRRKQMWDEHAAYAGEVLGFLLAAAPQPPEAGLKRENPTSNPEAAPVQMPNVDTIGVMLELESRIPFVESQTTRRAMEAAVQLLRILAAHGVK